MIKPTELQIILYSDKKKYCKHCNNDLTNINNSTYLKKRWGSSKFWDELCECDNCQNTFLLRHELFDNKGHIYLFVFSNDINNPEYHWTDNLNGKQKIAIEKHLEQCSICRKKIDDIVCADAELKNLFNRIKKRGNK